jgi:hypothetical protein
MLEPPTPHSALKYRGPKLCTGRVTLSWVSLCGLPLGHDGDHHPQSRMHRRVTDDWAFRAGSVDALTKSSANVNRIRKLFGSVVFTAGCAAWFALMMAVEKLKDDRAAWAVAWLVLAVLFTSFAIAMWCERRRSVGLTSEDAGSTSQEVP